MRRSVLLLFLFACVPVRAADKVNEAIGRGVEFLLKQQSDDGAINDLEKKRRDVNAMTGLSIMALAAVGHQPTDDTPEGKALARALEFILADGRQDASGYYGKSDGSRMYGHGIVTLMLAEMVGMGVDAQQDALIRKRCQRAVELILRAQRVAKKDQKHDGGWRYGPDAVDADLSVTVWQVMALRAAKNAGLDVPKEAIEQTVGYIKRSYTTKRNVKGAFGYQPGNGPTYSTASEGLLALQVCGEYDAPEVAGAASWLHSTPPNIAGNWFYYGTYYFAQGMYQRGGEFAEPARQTVESLMLAQQQPDGSWKGISREAESRVYCTALAVLSLSVRHHFMPIYQR
jgi:hypothetical protein